MNPISSPVDGITIERDLQRDLWRLRISEQVLTLRPWTWGERRRLVEFATAGALLNRGAFVDGLFDLLLDAAPPVNMRSEVALACMCLLGIPEGAAPVSLARAEYLMAATFGWPPRQLSPQPAADIDRLVQQVQPADASDDGWTHIVIVDAAQNPGLEVRLEAMFHAIALWAGLVDVSSPGVSTPPNAAMQDSITPAKAEVSREASSEPPAGDHDERPKFEMTFPGRVRLSRPPDSIETHPKPARGPIELSQASATVRAESEIESALKPPRTVAASPSRIPSPSGRGWREAPGEGSHAETSRPAFPHPALRATFSRREKDSLPVFPQSHPAGAVYDRPGRSQSAPTVSESDFFPSVRINVQWPDEKNESPAVEASSQATPVPPNPFALSEFEEQLADALDRAAREAGVDIP